MFLFDPNIKMFKLKAITYRQDELKDFNYVIRGLNFSENSSAHTEDFETVALMRLRSFDHGQEEIKSFRDSLTEGPLTQLILLTICYKPIELTGACVNRMRHACKNFGVVYKVDSNSIHSKDGKLLTMFELKSLTLQNDATLFNSKTSISYTVNPYITNEVPKPWEPDVIDPEVDIMDSIRRACQGGF